MAIARRDRYPTDGLFYLAASAAGYTPRCDATAMFGVSEAPDLATHAS